MSQIGKKDESEKMLLVSRKVSAFTVHTYRRIELNALKDNERHCMQVKCNIDEKDTSCS